MYMAVYDLLSEKQGLEYWNKLSESTKDLFLALCCDNQASTILSFLNYLTTNISFVKSVEICMWPLRFTPGVDGWKYGRKINCVQFIVNELSDIPRKIVVAEIWK